MGKCILTFAPDSPQSLQNLQISIFQKFLKLFVFSKIEKKIISIFFLPHWEECFWP